MGSIPQKIDPELTNKTRFMFKYFHINQNKTVHLKTVLH